MSTFDYVVTITDNTTTKTLTSSPYLIAEYHPRTDVFDQEFVTETLVIRVRDGSAANNLDELRGIQKLLKQAKEAQKDLNLGRVFITFLPTTGGTTYRSEIVEARGEWLADTMSLPRWVANSQRATIYITRRNWWEGPEAQLDLDNDNGTNNTSGLNVFNCNDTTGTTPNILVNFVGIDGADVDGDLMAPTRLELTNLYSTAATSYIYIGHNWTDPDNVVWHFEGEDGTTSGSVTSPSNQADATCSGGQYKQFTVGSGGEIPVLGWAFTAAQVDAMAGRYFKAFIRFQSTSDLTNTWFRLKLLSSGSLTGTNTTLWQMQSQVKPSTSYGHQLREIFTFPIGIPNRTNQDEVQLWIFIEQDTGSNVTYRIDFIDLIPVDGYRTLNPSGLTQNNRLIDDGIEEQTYVDDGSGSSKYRGVADGGSYIMLYPGKNQRLYFLQNSSTINTAEVNRKMSVKLHYRPRRISL